MTPADRERPSASDPLSKSLHEAAAQSSADEQADRPLKATTEGTESPGDGIEAAGAEPADGPQALQETAKGHAPASDMAAAGAGAADGPPRETAPPLPAGILRDQPLLTFLLPFVVYAVVGSLEPSAPTTRDQLVSLQSLMAVSAGTAVAATAPVATPAAVLALEEDYQYQMREARGEDQAEYEAHGTGHSWLGFKIPYHAYPLIYSIKIGLTAFSMLLVLPGYLTFPFRVNRIAVVVGVLGAIVWIVLCKLHLERMLFEGLLFEFLDVEEILEYERRPGYNPLAQLQHSPLLAWGFLAVRFIGLVIVVAIMEEFFLRGFVLRFVMDMDFWEEVPFGKVNDFAAIMGTLVPVIMHPKTEMLAVIAWFSAVTWLMIRTRNIWDCVTAHAVTNLILGIYVLFSGDWWLL